MLTIRTAPAEKELLREFGRGQVSAPALQIEFIDHGPGLSPQDRERVFTPFYTRKAKGMGLGLSIVKGIIEAHRGAIREIGDADTVLSQNMAAQGTRAHGAHFIIFLPVGEDESPDHT
jgi:signal transduction histidine kinase